VRPPPTTTWGLTGTGLRIDTQAADLFESSNNASVLIEPAPEGEYIVEAKVHLNVPPEGCCFNYVQAGLVIYGDDDNFVKLVHFSNFDTRQTEFAKEWFPVPAAGYPRYGNTVVGPPGEWTWLRIVKQGNDSDQAVGNPNPAQDSAKATAPAHQTNEPRYTAYTSRDGVHWEHGGTWTRYLEDPQIGLVSMGGSGFTATFDYVRVSKLRH
jgi:arabinan endo-1,5-alpha-L-arabinosidase